MTSKHQKGKGNESGLEKIVNISIGAAAIGTSYALFGTPGLFISSLSPLSGKIVNSMAGQEFKSRNFRDETIGGLLTTPIVVYTFDAIKNIPRYLGIDGVVNVFGNYIPAYSLAVGGLTLAAIPLYNAITYPLKYLIKNKSFRGFGKYFKENYWKDTKKALGYLGLPAAAAVALSATIPSVVPFLLPVYFGLGVAYRAITSGLKLDYKKFFDFINPFKHTKTPKPAYVH